MNCRGNNGQPFKTVIIALVIILMEMSYYSKAATVNTAPITIISGSTTTTTVPAVPSTIISGSTTTTTVQAVPSTIISGSTTTTTVPAVPSTIISGSTTTTTVTAVPSTIISGSTTTTTVLAVPSTIISGSTTTTTVPAVPSTIISGSTTTTTVTAVPSTIISGSTTTTTVTAVPSTIISGSTTTTTVPAVPSTIHSGSTTTITVPAVPSTIISGSTTTTTVTAVPSTIISGSTTTTTVTAVPSTIISGSTTTTTVPAVPSTINSGSTTTKTVPAVPSTSPSGSDTPTTVTAVPITSPSGSITPTTVTAVPSTSPSGSITPTSGSHTVTKSSISPHGVTTTPYTLSTKSYSVYTIPQANLTLKIDFSISIEKNFSKSLLNTSTQEYKNTSREFTQKLTLAYEGVPGFVRIEINGFSEGSIRCNYTVVTKGEDVNTVIDGINKTAIAKLKATEIDDAPVKPESITGMVNSLVQKADEVLNSLCASPSICQADAQCIPDRVKKDIQCKPYCSSDTCKNDGHCVYDIGSRKPQCKCYSDQTYAYSGEHCEIVVEKLALSSTYIIAISAGSGGFVIIVLTAIFIVCYRRRTSKSRTSLLDDKTVSHTSISMDDFETTGSPKHQSKDGNQYESGLPDTRIVHGKEHRVFKDDLGGESLIYQPTNLSNPIGRGLDNGYDYANDLSFDELDFESRRPPGNYGWGQGPGSRGDPLTKSAPGGPPGHQRNEEVNTPSAGRQFSDDGRNQGWTYGDGEMKSSNSGKREEVRSSPDRRDNGYSKEVRNSREMRLNDPQRDEEDPYYRRDPYTRVGDVRGSAGDRSNGRGMGDSYRMERGDQNRTEEEEPYYKGREELNNRDREAPYRRVQEGPSRGGREDPRGGRDDPMGGRDNPRGGRDDPRGGRDDPRGGRDDPYRVEREDPYRGGREDPYKEGREDPYRRGREDPYSRRTEEVLMQGSERTNRHSGSLYDGLDTNRKYEIKRPNIGIGKQARF